MEGLERCAIWRAGVSLMSECRASVFCSSDYKILAECKARELLALSSMMPKSSFYAVVIDEDFSQCKEGVKATTYYPEISPICNDENMNYLPNVLAKWRQKRGAQSIYIGLRSILPLQPIAMWDEKPIGDERSASSLACSASTRVSAVGLSQVTRAEAKAPCYNP
ncbi:hypothetical protein LIER_34303 [Lithospermum erythrorhizon]|uniref:Uncharacterized protein n=1 Tax=Lithospermum erythrorhizon TaxID=34254 RepID=A0AAV3S1H8_LITER